MLWNVKAPTWRAIWRDLEEAGKVDSLSISWVKAHTALADVENGIISMRGHLLNDLCDTYAKRGSEWACALSPVDDLVEGHRRAVALYRALQGFVVDWPQDHRALRAKRKKARVALNSYRVNNERPHWP